ncbi:MAG TPA: peptide chain release factor N(5)-glutamine methyltransferase [Clostridiales bacterium]|nr:peptide chain release factor N(5)-glutamine methyltransferase [Clostridiales bacterium]
MVAETLKELYEETLAAAPTSFEAGELFTHVTGVKPLDADARPATPEQKEKLETLLKRRGAGYPLQYLLGEWEFYSLPFKVGPGVLIPRQDTETLVDAALNVLKTMDVPTPQVLDLCSGTGCVAIAIKHNFPAAQVTAQEFSLEAYNYLIQNIDLNKVDVTPHLSDLREYTHPVPLDMVVSNPPYIPQYQFRDLQVEVGYEPLAALDGGEDGLYYFRAIARRFKEQLRPGGALLMEIGMGQEEDVATILRENHFEDIVFHKDLNGIIRVVESRNSAKRA